MKDPEKNNPCEQPLGEALIEGLTELRDTLKEGHPLEQRFTMRTVDLDLEPSSYEPEDVKRTRESLGASQSVFAKLVGVSTKTIQAWEQGLTPNATACRLMDLMNEDRQKWIDLLESATREANGTTA